MAWKDIGELLEDVYSTLQRVRSKRVELCQAKVESRLLDTGARLMLGTNAPLRAKGKKRRK